MRVRGCVGSACRQLTCLWKMHKGYLCPQFALGICRLRSHIYYTTFDSVVVMAMVYTIGCGDIVFLIGQLINRKIVSSGKGEGGRGEFGNV